MTRHPKHLAVPITASAGWTGALAFINAFFAADDDADIELGLNSTETARYVTATVEDCKAALTPKEARKLADVFENTLREYPESDLAGSMASVVMGLRECAVRVETDQ